MLCIYLVLWYDDTGSQLVYTRLQALYSELRQVISGTNFLAL